MAKSMPSKNVETHEKIFLKCVQKAVLESGSETDWIWIRNGLYPDSERIVSGSGTDWIRISTGQVGPTECEDKDILFLKS